MATFLLPCHQNAHIKNKTPMSNIGETLDLKGFVDSGRAFKTSAFNHSAISPEEKPASAFISGILSKVNAPNGLLEVLVECFRAIKKELSQMRGYQIEQSFS